MSVLCYHTVEPDCPTRAAVEPAAFAEQMQYLARRRVVVAPDRVPELLDLRGRLPRRTAAVTFDDGFTGVLEHAAPVLFDLGIPAMVFVVAQTLTPHGQPVDWVDDAPTLGPLQTLSRDQLRELSSAGVGIGSHSWAHRHLPELSEAEVRADLRESRTVLEDVVGHHVTQLAYPRGQHAPHVRRAAAAAGFAAAYSLPERREPPSRLAIPRVGIYPGNTVSEFRVKLSRRYLDVRLAPGTGVLREVVHRARRR